MKKIRTRLPGQAEWAPKQESEQVLGPYPRELRRLNRSQSKSAGTGRVGMTSAHAAPPPGHGTAHTGNRMLGGWGGGRVDVADRKGAACLTVRAWRRARAGGGLGGAVRRGHMAAPSGGLTAAWAAQRGGAAQ